MKDIDTNLKLRWAMRTTHGLTPREGFLLNPIAVWYLPNRNTELVHLYGYKR